MAQPIKLNQRKPKYKTYTPVNIAIPKAKAEMIKKIPRLSLQAIREGSGSVTDWYNLCFRIKVGHDLAKVVYTDEAVVALKEILDCVLGIKDRFVTTNAVTVLKDEVELIEMGLDYTDEMTDDATRRVQLEVFHTSDKYLKSVLKELDNLKGV